MAAAILRVTERAIIANIDNLVEQHVALRHELSLLRPRPFLLGAVQAADVDHALRAEVVGRIRRAAVARAPINVIAI